MANPICSKCSGVMEAGYMVDGQGHKAFRQALWAPGPPQPDDSKFLGMKMNFDWMLKLREDQLRPVASLRCNDCGYLELYAP